MEKRSAPAGFYGSGGNDRVMNCCMEALVGIYAERFSSDYERTDIIDSWAMTGCCT